jgi:hypothetical protein
MATIMFVFTVYTGIADYGDVRESLPLLISDIAEVFPKSVEALTPFESPPTEPVEVEVWARDPEDVERQLLANWRAQNPGTH